MGADPKRSDHRLPSLATALMLIDEKASTVDR